MTRPRHYARFIRFADCRSKVWAPLRGTLLYLASLARAASVSALSGDDQAQRRFLIGTLRIQSRVLTGLSIFILFVMLPIAAVNYWEVLQ